MNFLLKSHSFDNYMLFLAALALFILPVLLFRPVEKSRHVSRSPRKNTAILADTSQNSNPSMDYWLYYHNPVDFLFADDSRSFAFFRTFEKEPASLLPPPPLANPPFPVPSLNLKEMTSAPLPSKPLLFDAPLSVPQTAHKPLPQTSTPCEYPVLRLESGVILPFPTEKFPTSDIRSLNPERPSIFRIHPPDSPSLPFYAELAQSCGIRRLDLEALRILNTNLLSGDFRKQIIGERITVFWLQRMNLSETPDTQEDPES